MLECRRLDVLHRLRPAALEGERLSGYQSRREPDEREQGGSDQQGALWMDEELLASEPSPPP